MGISRSPDGLVKARINFVPPVCALQENQQSQPAYFKKRLVFKGQRQKKNANKTIDFIRVSNWLRGLDLNQRPSGYEPDELPGCSTPRSRVLIIATSQCTGQVIKILKWIHAVTNPVAGQFQEFQINALDRDARPVLADEFKVGRARIKFYLRRVMLERRQRAPRMIP